MDATSSYRFTRSLTAPAPRSLWIELTSVCPFDCIFCSRRLRRGNGEHMDFELYQRIIGQLDRPDVIRLNYSGESIHYPRLKDAIVLAKQTGATVELVTALASASKEKLAALVDAGLDRLTISLHALDPGLYQRIYRFSSAEKLQDSLAYLQEKKGQGRHPQLDLSFVAIAENLAELPRLAEFAAENDISSIAVHPVIRRDLIPLSFGIELENGSELRPGFLARIEEAGACAREAAPGVGIQVARPAEPQRPTGHRGFAMCEQNPWETIHILANGDAVACEVQDHVSLGSLELHTLQEVWFGAPYVEFRERYLANRDITCQNCAWYQFTSPASNDPVWLRGWHPFAVGDGVHWSQASAALWIPTAATEPRFGISGVLPPASEAEPLRLTISADGYAIGTVENCTGESKPFDFSAYLPVIARRDGGVLFSFECSRTHCPADRGASSDLRRLGFGLHSLEINPPGAQRPISKLKRMLAAPLVASSRRAAPRAIASGELGAGVSIVIPESGTPDVLAQCLAALGAALEPITEPCDVIVWVNGAPAADYASLRGCYPRARFHFTPRRQGFSSAVHAALAHARHPWVYLLNSDAIVEPAALTEVLPLRRADRFAIASQIESYDVNQRRIESNWTRLAVEAGLVQLWDAYPVPAEPAPMPYAGGTAALYQTEALRRLSAATAAYDPFYWEDVEWGAAAALAGLTCWIAPASRVRHLRRATVNKVFGATEAERIFERNRLLFQLRGYGPQGEPAALRDAIAQASWRTLWELYRRTPAIDRVP